MTLQFFQYALIGGILIGISTSLMLLINGKILGISGIVSATLSKIKSEHTWRYSFILGLLSGGLFVKYFNPTYFDYTISLSWYGVIFGGLLVGLGTTLGNGCTSGHGICGLSRFSIRSLVATCLFMSVAIVTVYVRRHLL
tara:strand:+ start:20656 stop:21075 length:420 start_codon:yes stop_codon:yes gene_type:complete